MTRQAELGNRPGTFRVTNSFRVSITAIKMNAQQGWFILLAVIQ